MPAPRNKVGHSDFLDAYPTAPGGMSEAALAAELTKHGWLTSQVVNLNWRQKIEAVIQSRLDRGDGKAEVYVGTDENGNDVYEPKPAAEKPKPAKRAAKKATPKPTKPVLTDDDLWTDDPDDEDEEVQSSPEPTAPDVEPDDLDALLDEMYEGNVSSEAHYSLMDAEPSVETIEFAASIDTNPVVYALNDLEDVAAEFGVDLGAEPIQLGPGVGTFPSSPLFLGMPDTLDYIFDGHAGAGPSASHRWMHCTASLGASRRFLETLTPNQQAAYASGTLAASQGTTAHAAGEAKINLMLGRISEAEAENALLDLTITPDSAGEAFDSEMEENLDEYVAYAKTLADDGHEVRVEQRVSAVIPLTGIYSGEVHTITGSADLIGLPTVKDKVLYVGDLKYGNGLDVSVEANPQVRIYGLGVLGDLVDEDGDLLYDIERIEYVIVQPRLGGIKVWSEPLDDLLEWRDEVLAPALTAALYGPEEGAVFAPSEDGCQFCPARGGCAALTEERMSSAAQLFDTLVESQFAGGDAYSLDAGALDSTRLGELLTQVSNLVALKDSLKEEAQRRLHRGEDVPGFWLVNYSPVREWTAEAEEGLAKAKIPKRLTHSQPKLLTPKQAMTAIGKEAEDLIGHLVSKPEKRPVISTGVKDKRKKWTERAPEDMFSALPESED